MFLTPGLVKLQTSRHRSAGVHSMYLYKHTSFVELFDELLFHAHVDWQLLDPSLSNAGSKSRLPHMALLVMVFLGPWEERATDIMKKNFLDTWNVANKETSE